MIINYRLRFDQLDLKVNQFSRTMSIFASLIRHYREEVQLKSTFHNQSISSNLISHILRD